MAGHTVILTGDRQRAYARLLVDKAPQGYVVTVSEPKRSKEQNSLMWRIDRMVCAGILTA